MNQLNHIYVGILLAIELLLTVKDRLFTSTVLSPVGLHFGYHICLKKLNRSAVARRCILD